MLRKLIQTARRRLFFNEALRQFALSTALAIGGLALLLTLGTRYVEWWVVAIFAAGVTAWAIVQLRRRLPTDYAAAVWLDEKIGLHDTISTAHYFEARGHSDPKTEAVLRAQRGQAESMAGDVDVAIAVPFRFPKALYGLAALLLVSTGLVSVRYFYGHNLNLSAPITEVVFQDLAAVKPPLTKQAHAPDRHEEFEEARSLLSKLGLGADLEEKPDQKLDQALADALRSAEKTPGSDENAKYDPSLNKGDPLDQPKDAPKNNSGPQSGDSNKKNGDPGSDSPGNQNSGQSGEKSEKSLLAKLKDAMENMMGSPKQQSEKKNGDSKQKSKASSSKMDPSEEAGQAGDEENKMSADGKAEGASQKSNSPGQTSGNSPDKEEGPAAAGSEDGEKAIKAAAQSKAMGKISELIGKRSEQVTGESMIEVQSGNQRLQTAYKDKAATHGEGAGEVSRDQIPLSVQAYVQEYFQQVRKPENTTKKAAPKTKQ